MMLSAPSGRMNVVATPNATATVFVVDDDVSVRESLELLISAAGWQPLTFESAKEFLAHPRHSGACCLILDVALPWPQRPRAPGANPTADRHADYFHHRARRHPHERPRDEGWGCRVPDEALQ